MRILILLLLSNFTLAFSLTPLSQSIVMGQNNDTVIYQVSNKNKEPIALEVSLVKREMLKSGKEEQPEVKDGQFLLYPTQLILKPGQKRGIKVQWLGGKISSEGAYRIKVEQLPIDFKKEKSSGIKLLLKYLGALYVTKDSFKPKLSASIVEVVDGKVLIDVKNAGKRHKILRSLELKLSKNDQKIELSGKELKGIDGENILAEMTRRFELILPQKYGSYGVNKAWGIKLKYD